MHAKELEAYVIFVLEAEGSGSTRVRRQQRLARGREEGQEKGGLGQKRGAGEKRLRFYPFLLSHWFIRFIFIILNTQKKCRRKLLSFPPFSSVISSLRYFNSVWTATIS